LQKKKLILFKKNLGKERKVKKIEKSSSFGRIFAWP
jgi:hypothetical protein